jgi:hypothetical protein
LADTEPAAHTSLLLLPQTEKRTDEVGDGTVAQAVPSQCKIIPFLLGIFV